MLSTNQNKLQIAADSGLFSLLVLFESRDLLWTLRHTMTQPQQLFSLSPFQIHEINNRRRDITVLPNFVVGNCEGDTILTSMEFQGERRNSLILSDYHDSTVSIRLPLYRVWGSSFPSDPNLRYQSFLSSLEMASQ